MNHDLLAALPDLPRDLYITGKGGVGKSTIAQQIAGKRGGSLLAMEDRGAPSHATIITSEQSLEDCAAEAFGSRRLARLVLRPRAIRRFIAVTPGLAEACRMMCIDAAPGPRTIDLPATGHAIDWLAGPPKLTTLVQAGRGAGMLQELLARWRDPTQSGLIVVTTPETLVVSETLALLRALRATSPIAISAVVINRGLRCNEDTEEWLEAQSQLGQPDAQRALHTVRATRHALDALAEYAPKVCELAAPFDTARAA